MSHILVKVTGFEFIFLPIGACDTSAKPEIFSAPSSLSAIVSINSDSSSRSTSSPLLLFLLASKRK
ncbi:hypothetical protein [Apibacter mensalis]|uniref:hypothetical protein n=1 Tax=Apibacter mensalis TaxID=1586267 RepID=UPI0026EE94A1|nr:hypothetical protein [Apibacter mensalis]